MTQVQKTYEKILNIGVIILAAWHMLMSVSKYYFANYKAEMAYAGLLAAAACLYLLLSIFKWKENRYRIKNLFSKFRSPHQILCMILFAWTILSFIVNGLPYFKDNLWLIFDAGIDCLILFNLPMVLSKDKAKKAIDLLLHIVSVFGLAVVLYGLWHLFTLNFIKLKTKEIIGMGSEYTFRLGCHYNLTAAITLSFILIAFYMIATRKNLLKILYAAALIPHTLALLLTNSRAGFLACISAYSIVMFLTLWNLPGERSVFERIFISVIYSIFTATVIWMMRTLAFQLFESVTHYSSNAQALLPESPMSVKVSEIPGVYEISRCLVLFSIPAFLDEEMRKKLQYGIRNHLWISSKFTLIAVIIMIICILTNFNASIPGENPNIAITQTDETEKMEADQTEDDAKRDLTDTETMKIRKGIWKSAIDTMTSDWRSFLFGVTPIGVSKILAHAGAHAHNQILQIGVSIGAPMMLVFTAIIILTGIKCIPLGLLKGNRVFQGAYILPAVFITFIILTLVEAYLFASFSIMSCLFFLFCGWINALDAEK